MACEQCGANNPAEARFCYNCGSPITRRSPVSVPPVAPVPPAPPAQAWGWGQPAYPVYPGPYAPPLQRVPPPPLPGDSPVLEFHPLAHGVRGLPYPVLAEPKMYYSYVNPGGKLVFARRAGFWNRAVSLFIDLFGLALPFLCILSLAIGVLESWLDPGRSFLNANDNRASILGSAIVGLLIMVTGLAYFILTSLNGGQSLGKRLIKIRVIRLDGQHPDWFTAIMRYALGYPLSANFLAAALASTLGLALTGNTGTAGTLAILAIGWGFWWVGVDELKQGWHDKLARTLVVETREFVEGVDFIRPQG